VDKQRALALQLAKTKFLEELLMMMIDRGFGVLPARQMAIETLGLILKYHPRWCNNSPSAYELARVLRSSPRKIRGYLDDISYRNPELDEATLNEELRQILLSGERVREGSYVAIEIDDGLVRAHARELVRQNLGIAEQGNAQTVLKLSGKQYATICLAVFPEGEVQALMIAFDEELPPLNNDAKDSSSLPLKLVERFLLAVSDEAGKKAVDLGFTFLTGGLSDLPDLIQNVRKLLLGDGVTKK
jgi:hypothetical protein